VVVPPENHAAWFREPLQRLGTFYGCLVSVGQDNRSIAKGTAIFVKVAGIPFMVTARHVVTAGLMAAGRPHLMLSRLDADGRALHGVEHVPRIMEVEIDSSLVWASQSLDVAILKAPQVLVEADEACFFDGLAHAATVSRLRTFWRRTATEDLSLPYFVLGFPNFGHLVDEQDRVELLSAIPLPAYISHLDPEPWDGQVQPAPQVLVEVDAHSPARQPANLEPRAQEMYQRLHAPVENALEPFGGYSGGALVVIGSDGEHLVGVVREGGTIFGQQRVVASALDDVLLAFMRSAEWRSLFPSATG
jgi:hypothetical protein